jgi:GH18 family chitinase
VSPGSVLSQSCQAQSENELPATIFLEIRHIGNAGARTRLCASMPLHLSENFIRPYECLILLAAIPEPQNALRPFEMTYSAGFKSLRPLLVSVGIISCVLAVARAQTATKIVGYYYGKGRPDYDFSRVPVQKITHLIYSHAVPTAEGDCDMAHPDVDIPNLKSLKSIRAKNTRLSVLLSIGGWSGSRYFSDVAATSSRRSRFSLSCLKILHRYDLDGIDIDWEYPVSGGKKTDHRRERDKENFLLLLRQLRRDLDALHRERRPLLTIACTGYRNHLDDLSAKEMADVLDWFNLMGYDFNEMQPDRTFHHSGLFESATTGALNADAIKFANSDAAVRWYLGHGVPPAKIVLACHFMDRGGRTFLMNTMACSSPTKAGPVKTLR